MRSGHGWCVSKGSAVIDVPRCAAKLSVERVWSLDVPFLECADDGDKAACHLDDTPIDRGRGGTG